MYNVFVNDYPIIFTDSTADLEKENSYHYDFININEIIHKLKTKKITSAILYCDNLKKMWTDFSAKITPIYAAGGLVENSNKEFLLIYRLNKWDLPKGHIELGEHKEKAAIREVEEECGINDLKINTALITTYHIIAIKNSYKLKVVYWYKMTTTDTKTPTPQLEEDITQAVWKDKTTTALLLANSYANIQLVFNTYTNDK